MLLISSSPTSFTFFFQAEDGIRALYVTGVQTCALPISRRCDRLLAVVNRGPPRRRRDRGLRPAAPGVGSCVRRPEHHALANQPGQSWLDDLRTEQDGEQLGGARHRLLLAGSQ